MLDEKSFEKAEIFQSKFAIPASQKRKSSITSNMNYIKMEELK